jgi:hypothetical protein
VRKPIILLIWLTANGSGTEGGTSSAALSFLTHSRNVIAVQATHAHDPSHVRSFHYSTIEKERKIQFSHSLIENSRLE